MRACLEHTVELDPDYSDAWAVLANIYAQEHRFGFNPRSELYDSRERSLTAAYRAVEIEPGNPTAQLMLANALFDRRNLAGFRAAGERAITLNPNDPDLLAHYGMRLTFIGEWERGLALVTKAIALNPEHPQWYDTPVIYRHYQTKDYERALVESQRQEVFGDIWWLLYRAMILGQLGRSEEAQPVIEAALRLKPDVGERFLGHGTYLERARAADRAYRGRPEGRPRHSACVAAFVIRRVVWGPTALAGDPDATPVSAGAFQWIDSPGGAALWGHSPRAGRFNQPLPVAHLTAGQPYRAAPCCSAGPEASATLCEPVALGGHPYFTGSISRGRQSCQKHASSGLYRRRPWPATRPSPRTRARPFTCTACPRICSSSSWRACARPGSTIRPHRTGARRPGRRLIAAARSRRAAHGSAGRQRPAGRPRRGPRRGGRHRG